MLVNHYDYENKLYDDDTFVPLCTCIKPGSNFDDIVGKSDFMYDDYVMTRSDAISDICNGMIWCDLCGSRLIFDPYVAPELISYDNPPDDIPISQICDKYDIYKVALVYIICVTPNNLLALRPISDDTILDDDIGRTIVSLGSDKYPYLPDDKTLRYYGVCNTEDCRCATQHETNEYGECASCDDDYCKHEKAFAISVESYDLYKPATPYPDGIDFRHDGVYVKMICRSATGQEYDFMYWGC